MTLHRSPFAVPLEERLERVNAALAEPGADDPARAESLALAADVLRRVLSEVRSPAAV